MGTFTGSFTTCQSLLPKNTRNGMDNVISLHGDSNSTLIANIDGGDVLRSDLDNIWHHDVHGLNVVFPAFPSSSLGVIPE